MKYIVLNMYFRAQYLLNVHTEHGKMNLRCKPNDICSDNPAFFPSLSKGCVNILFPDFDGGASR
jgi:hypothetical protein